MKREDHAKIVDWPEIPKNFAHLTDKGQMTRIPARIWGKYPSKKIVLKKMLTLLHDHGFFRSISIGENHKPML